MQIKSINVKNNKMAKFASSVYNLIKNSIKIKVFLKNICNISYCDKKLKKSAIQIEIARFIVGKMWKISWGFVEKNIFIKKEVKFQRKANKI